MTTSQIDNLNREIATLREREAREREKQAGLLGRINRANDAASRTKSAATLKSKAREIENAYRDLAAVEKRLANLGRQIADKAKRLHSYEERQARENERERKKLATEMDRQARKSAEEQKRLIRERETHERRTTMEVLQRARIPRVPLIDAPNQEHNDFFICHASEDKEGFVRQLAETLEDKGASVWYDEFTLNVGDSLRREIDRGLANSRFGVVILSEAFFKKEWPQKELDGLVALEIQGLSRILPIWHKVSVDEVARYSPMLADKVALNTSLKSVEDIAEALLVLSHLYRPERWVTVVRGDR